MNAKKIMGAVLVALLAAALFVGAGAADPAKTEVNIGDTVFLYQNVTGLNGTWVNGANTITAIALDGKNAGYFAGDSIVEGTYKQGELEITVKYPTATISGVAVKNSKQYTITGSTLYQGAEWANFTVISPSGAELTDVVVTLPNGEVMTGLNFVAEIAVNKMNYQTGMPNSDSEWLALMNWAKTNGYYDAQNTATTLKFSLGTDLINNLTTGTYKFQGLFNKSETSDNGELIASTPDKYLVGKDVFTVVVAESGDVTISANAESILANKIVAVTVTGQPGEEYTIKGDHLTVDSLGTVVGNTSTGKFTMPNDGEAVLYVYFTKDGKNEITINDKTGNKELADITIEVIKGSITAETDKESYFIGNTVTISGTSTATEKLAVFIKGTNVEFQTVNKTDGTIPVVITVGNDDTWEYDLTADMLKAVKVGTNTPQTLDAGTYTLYLIADDLGNGAEYDKLSTETYVTVSLVLKQPFISVTDAPAVAVMKNEYKVTGTAEAATNGLAVYVFGTNFYAATDGSVPVVSGEIFLENPVKIDGNEFTIKFTVSEKMAAGQYFMVIQHPMYDEFFNIQSDASGNIILNNTQTTNTTLFNVYERQTANAAQALCDALETQNVDDMYVKLSFVVAAATSTINPIPAEITQGSKLTISGQTNLGEGETVVVEMLSTAFAAVPKETVGSAAFATVMTKTLEDGTWEVTIDTTGMNVDEYTVSVAVADLDATTAKINIIEGAPTEQPTEQPTTQPTQTEQPTEAPATPGFGALAALAGLGAVAVLLLRRE